MKNFKRFLEESSVKKQKKKVINALKSKNIKFSKEEFDEDEFIFIIKSGLPTLVLNGDSMWNPKLKKGQKVKVKKIEILNQGDGIEVRVYHNIGWEVYTDTGFEKSLSKYLGFRVYFSEQGMQEDEYSHLES